MKNGSVCGFHRLMIAEFSHNYSKPSTKQSPLMQKSRWFPTLPVPRTTTFLIRLRDDWAFSYDSDNHPIPSYPSYLLCRLYTIFCFKRCRFNAALTPHCSCVGHFITRWWRASCVILSIAEHSFMAVAPHLNSIACSQLLSLHLYIMR